VRRADGRRANQLRPLKITRGYTDAPAGSVLIETGRTRVLCTVTVEEDVPRRQRLLAGNWRRC